jgi:tetratricopeptide (TPR) repeat protein
MEIDNYDKAIESFNKCIKINSARNKIDETIGISIAYYYKNDKQNANKYFQQAKQIRPELNRGMEGISVLEKEGYSYSEKKKETLKKMFEEFK